MLPLWFFITNLLAFIQAQSTDFPENVNNGSRNGGGFLVPIELSYFEDSFPYDDKEYIFVNDYFTKKEAKRFCELNYRGQIADIFKVMIGEFLVEAMTQVTFKLDQVWVGGVIDGKKWFTEDLKPFPLEMYPLRIPLSSVLEKRLPRPCIAFARYNHANPIFLPLRCEEYRPVLCQRLFNQTNRPAKDTDNWIILGSYQYKIFYDRVTFENASINCFRASKFANLAYVPPEYVSTLARYLLIGRPSLENAWIGSKAAKRGEYHWLEGKALPNETNLTTNYPPWKNGKATKEGCVRLDRHLSQAVWFVEAPCHHHHAYICSKPYDHPENYTEWHIDFTFRKWDYRLFFRRVSWHVAHIKCRSLQRMYNVKSQLAEIHDNETLSEILFLLGENRTAVQHLWLGGWYDWENPQWVWESNNETIEPSDYFKIIRNESTEVYNPIVEDNNRCLNIDRENHRRALIYGTDCSYSQAYACQFEHGKLKKVPSEKVEYDLMRAKLRKKPGRKTN